MTKDIDISLDTPNHVLTEGFSVEYNNKNSVEARRKNLFQDVLNGREESFHIKLRETLQAQKWGQVEDIIDSQLKQLHFDTARSVVGFINDEFVQDSESEEIKIQLPRFEIKTGLIFTGINISEHSKVFKVLEKLLTCNENNAHQETNTRNIVVRLNSKNGGNLKAITIQFLSQFLQEHDKDNEESAEIRVSNYDMSLFEDYYQEKYKDGGKPRVVIMLEDFEGFSGSSVSDFIMVLSKYVAKNEIPIVLVLGVSTTISSIHQVLKRPAIQRLNIAKFSLGTAQELINHLISSLFIETNSCLNFGFTSYKHLIKQFLHSNLSIYQFKSLLKYSFMDFFYGNPLSILSALIDSDPSSKYNEGTSDVTCAKDLRLTSDHMDMILMQPSVMRFLENISSNDKNFLKSSVTDLSFFSEKTLPRIMLSLQFFQKRYELAIRLVEAMQNFFISHKKNFTKYPTRVLHYNALDSNFEFSAPWKSIVSSLRFLNGKEMHTLLGVISSVAETQEGLYQKYIANSSKNFDFTGIDYLKFISVKARQEVHSCIKLFNNTETSKTNVGESAIYTRTQIRENPYLLVNKSGDVAFESFLRKANSTIPKLVLDLLTHYSVYPLQEIFYYKKPSFLSQSFNPQPKTAIQTALSKPSHYLGECACCKLKNEFTEKIDSKQSIDPILPTNNDVSIAYRLHLESGQMINLYDWFMTFSSFVSIKPQNETCKSSKKKYQQASDTCEPTVNLQVLNRFILSVNTLCYLGFIKKTNRKTDHVTKLTWGYI